MPTLTGELCQVFSNQLSNQFYISLKKKEKAQLVTEGSSQPMTNRAFSTQILFGDDFGCLLK
jgi:hypothetical protein